MYIYKYENKLNHHIYIGQTVDFNKRQREHKYAAYDPTSRDHNFAIHLAIEKYKLENFDIDIIEICDDNIANERERYWIAYYDSYNNGYNETPGGQDGGGYNGKQVDGYDLDGNYVKSWINAKECAKELNTHYSVVQQVLHQKRPTCKSFQLKYNEDSRVITKFVSRQGGTKKINKLDDNGCVLATYKSIAEAGRENQCDPSSITKVLKGKLVHCGGYRWAYVGGESD